MGREGKDRGEDEGERNFFFVFFLRTYFGLVIEYEFLKSAVNTTRGCGNYVAWIQLRYPSCRN